MDPKERIILALDVAEFKEAINIVDQFKSHITIFKVGSELFTAVGPKIIDAIHSRGKKVFLDLKYFDIPSTVKKSAVAATELGVFMLTIHTLGGFEMMKETAETLIELAHKKNIARPKMLGVTLLTSINESTLREELNIGQSITTQVRHLARLALRAGLDGVVASPLESELVRAQCGNSFLIVTPGIRPSWTNPDEQKRTMTPQQALKKGADYLVIGRAITAQPDPIKAFVRIIEELKA
jgi:orotidine-5'-phosphate decarboxylase